jgi:non-ribosomal peptide synthetase component E (peptide arylation enzyme)
VNDTAIGRIFCQAQHAPGKIALHYLDHAITYGDFACWISLAREFLARQDLRPGSVAALARVPNVFDAWVLRLALQNLGVTTVDLSDPGLLGGLSFRNIGCVVTTIHDQAVEAPDAEYKLLRIPDPLFLGKSASGIPDMAPMNVAPGGHILVTSGTTGVRKKLLRDAAGLAGEIKRRCNLLSISEDSVVHAFNFGPWAGTGYFSPACAWSAGGTVVFQQGKDLHRSFQIDKITHAVVTPMKLQEILETPRGELRSHPEMRLLVGGAPLTAALAHEAKSRLTPNVIHYLTSTEGGPLALTRIDATEDLAAHVLVPGADVQIVDSEGKPLTAGQVGAMRVRPTDGVSGYLDDEDASRQCFRDGYFYPGDLAEIRADGKLVLHGRVSNVINFGGEKRAAEIIEQQMQDKLGVEAICLLSLPGPSLHDELHILLRSGRAITKAELVDALTSVALLPGPPDVHLHHVDTIARNEMGKIDRAAARQKISAGLAAGTGA